jgi:hypothetical protein
VDPHQKPLMLFAFTFGISFAVMELFCYVSFFMHLYNHNNTIAINVVTPAVIKQRNQVNAISMFGLLCSWILEIHYILVSAAMSVFAEGDHIREVAAILKLLEFVLVPVVCCLCKAKLIIKKLYLFLER